MFAVVTRRGLLGAWFLAVVLACGSGEALGGAEEALPAITLAAGAEPDAIPWDLLAHLTDPGEGWTAFRPSADTRIIYVSSSEGKDTNDGLSPERPFKTIAKGFALLRNDHSDWLLLKRGDVWFEPIGSVSVSRLKNGRSEKEPTLIGSYGAEGPRPLLKLGDHDAGLSAGVNRPGKVRNMAVVGIHFYDHKGDPASPDFVKEREKRGAGISWGAPGENLLIEDCRFQYLTAGAIQGRSPWKGLPDDVFRNVKVRRCVAEHAWSTSGHCQGFFFSKIDGLLLEENVLDHNGYCIETGDTPTWFNHNVYITIECDKVVARGNIVARGSTTGIYCRTNGILEDNLCLDNSPSLNLGRITKFRPGGVTGRITGNVVIGSLPRMSQRQGDVGGGPAIEVGNVNRNGVLVANNIVIGSGTERRPAFTISPAGVGAHNVTVRNNTTYNWPGFIGWVGEPGKELKKLTLSDNVVKNNLFQIHSLEAPLGWAVRTRDTADASGFTFSGNVYHYAPAAKECVELVNQQHVTLEKWLAISKDEGGRMQKVAFVEPTRNAATWHGTLGREATREAFLAGAHKQSKHNWRKEYTAAAVIAYIREGFRPVTALDGEPAGAVPRD